MKNAWSLNDFGVEELIVSDGVGGGKEGTRGKGIGLAREGGEREGKGGKEDGTRMICWMGEEGRGGKEEGGMGKG